MRIRTKLILTFLSISIIPIIFISSLSFSHAKTSLQTIALKSLHIVALAKKAEVMEYVSGKKGRTIDFASDGFIRDQAEFIAGAKNVDEKIRASKALNEHLRLNKKPLDQEILEIRVLGLQGGIIGASEGEYLLGLSTGREQPYFLQGLQRTYVQDSGIFVYQGQEEEVIAIGTPLKSRTTGKVIGVLANFYTLANIQDVLLGIKSHQWDDVGIAGAEKTSRDIYLVNQKGLLLTPSKKVGIFKPLHTKIPTEPVIKAIESALPINKSWIDIRGNEMLGASALLQIEKDWKWILVMEQNKNEVLTPVYVLRSFTVSAGIIVLLLVIVIALLMARSIAVPLRKAASAADIISKGESWEKINITLKDEIGELARSFNRMVEKRQAIEDELRLAKTRIGEEKTKCEMVLASIGDGMIVVNQDGNVMMMNHEAENMFGWELIELVGRNLAENISCEDEKGGFIGYKERIMTQALSSNKTIHANAYYYRKDNAKFPASVTASPITFEGKVIGAIGIFRDITKEKEVDRMKTDFVSTVSHEIRTPLTTIREGISQALDGILGEITDKQRDVFTIALEDSDRLKRIIDNLLDIAKIEAGKVELKKELADIVSLVKASASAFSLSAKEKGIEIRAHFSKPKIKVFVDRDRIIQVFTNLIGNSLKFTPHGYIDIFVDEKDGCVECAVSDSGKGIAKDNLTRLFSKFQQFGRVHGPGEKGTGLGLSICKGIIELHKGKIWAESEVSKGTRVNFILPQYTPGQLFKEYVETGIKKLDREKNILSLVVFNIHPLAAPHTDDNADEAALAEELADMLKRKMRFDADSLVESDNLVLMLFAGVGKKEALEISERFRHLFSHYAARKGFGAPIDIAAKVITYPEDGKTSDELVHRIESIS